MSETIPNVPVTYDDWVDISTVSGVAAGTKYKITNQKGAWVLLYESNTKPSLSETNGQRLSVFPDIMSTAYIDAGSLKIWAKLLHKTVIDGSELNIDVL